jgi:predicted Zn-dependent protease
MGSFFFNLGRNVGSGLRKGKWFWQSVAGSTDDALRAEHEAGRDMAWELLRQFEADTDPAVMRLLDDLNGRLSACVRDRRRRFCVCPVKAAEVNAFALPGGFLFVTRSLLELCGRDADELAFVLGHEMGHVLYGHAMERIMQGWMLDAAGRMVPVRGMAGTWLLQQASTLIHTGYSRDQELEADALGARLARAAGYDGRAALRLLGRLPASAGPTAGLDAYFATHPPVAERLAQLNRVLQS